MRSSLARTAVIGAAQGGLLYGTGVAIAQLVYNGIASPFDALQLWLPVALVFGLAGAALFSVIGAIAGLIVPLDDDSDQWRSGLKIDWSLLLGFWAYAVLFWVPFFLYGLTYDQTLLVRPVGASVMAGYLVVAALVIALACAVVAMGVQRAIVSVERDGRLQVTLLALSGLAVGAVVGVAVLRGQSTHRVDWNLDPEARAREELRFSVPVRETGLKVVLLGLDGLDPDVLDRLVEEGRLPTFERLRQLGLHGRLDTLPDANSAVIWASIYTGYPPAVHGVHDFYKIHFAGIEEGLFPAHRTYFKELVGWFERFGLARREVIVRADLGVPTLWEVVDRAGLSVGVVDGYFYSFPAPDLFTEDGFFVSYGVDTWAGAVRTGKSDTSDRSSYLQPPGLLQRLGLPEGGDFEWQSSALLSMLRATPEGKGEQAVGEARRPRSPQPRLISLYTHEPDTVQHQNWRAFEPWRYLDPAESTGATDPVTAMYERFDSFLEELLPLLDSRTVLMIVSDHGHSPTLAHRMDTQHRHGPAGVYLFHGPAFLEGYRYDRQPVSVYDIYPTILYLLGLPVPRDLPGRVLEGAVAPGLLTAFPVRQGDSYQGLPPPPSALRVDQRDDEAELEKLRELGYIER